MSKFKDRKNFYIVEEDGSRYYPYFRSNICGKFGKNYYPRVPRKLKKAFAWFSYNNRNNTRIGGNKLFNKIDASIVWTEVLRFDNNGYQLDSWYSGVAAAYERYKSNH